MIENTSLCKTVHLSEKTAYSCTLAEKLLVVKLSIMFEKLYVRETINDEKTRRGMLRKSLKGNILSQKIIPELETWNILSHPQVLQLAQALEVTEP